MKTPVLTLVILFALAFSEVNCARKATRTASVSTDTTTIIAGSSAGNSPASSSVSASGNATAASPASEYPAYVGRYKMESDEVPYLNVVLEGDKLFGFADNQPKTEITYESKDRFNFQTPDISGTVTFSRDTQQQVNGLTVRVNGNELKGERVKQ